MKRATLVLVCALAAAPAWAINKCTGVDGKVSFQDAPCVGKGEELQVRPASGQSPSAPAAAPAAPPAPSSSPGATPVPAPAPAVASAPSNTAKSPLEREATMCLAWYRPLLRDPAGAYFTEPSKDKRVLSMTVHATNGFGGYVTRNAACEIHQGKLEATWTRIHADRAGW